MTNATAIKSQIRQNTQVMDIFSTEDLIKAWEQTTGKDIAQATGIQHAWVPIIPRQFSMPTLL